MVTLFLPTTKAFFEKSENDSLLGYNFLIENSLIHPRFHIPVVFRDYYNSTELTWIFESKMKNDIKTTKVSELKNSVLENKVNGHIPMLLNLLQNSKYKRTAIEKTSIKEKDCIQINFLDSDSIDYSLFIDRNTKMPTLLRIIYNKEQPFIEEYYYNNFIFSNTDTLPLATKSIQDNSKNISSIKIGDYIPDWKLETIDGVPLHFKEQKGKTLLIFLSGIKCGFCQAQIPMTKRIYDQLSQHKDLNIVGLYMNDTNDRLKIYRDEHDLQYPIINNSLTSDEERHELIQKFHFPIPTIILIDKEQKVNWIKTGFSPDYSDKYFDEVIKQVNKIGELQ